ncbi:MAG: hypothetical protein ACLP51_08855 [Syntrophobacteraceae bacterium]
MGGAQPACGEEVYDAYILRCAQKYLAPLVSLDRYLADSAKGMGIRVMEVADVGSV